MNRFICRMNPPAPSYYDLGKALPTSGPTGPVKFEGVVFSDGSVAVRWHNPPTFACFETVKSMLTAQGMHHEWRVLEWPDGKPA